MGGMRHATPLYAKVNSGEHTQDALFAKPPFPGPHRRRQNTQKRTKKGAARAGGAFDMNKAGNHIESHCNRHESA